MHTLFTTETGREVDNKTGDMRNVMKSTPFRFDLTRALSSTEIEVSILITNNTFGVSFTHARASVPVCVCVCEGGLWV
jgi:hypothetical protein